MDETVLRKSSILLMVLMLAGCQSRTISREAIEKELAVKLTCDVLRRVEVTPNDLDKLSPSTQYEIETNPLYQAALKCRKAA